MKKTITEGELKQAIEKFQSKGGGIKVLPEQAIPKNLLVGGKWGAFEVFLDAESLLTDNSKN